MRLFHELKRRNVFRVAAAYVALAWLVVQVAETLIPTFGFDPGVLRTVILVAAIGSIPAVIGAWLLELTPDGLRADDGVEDDPGFSRKTKDRLNRVIIVSLSLAVTYFAVDKFVLSGDNTPALAADVSIAVLPFVNQSDSAEMVFFSDGVAEDILGLLSKTRGLRSIARSSSFALRDPTIPASVVGERLSVEYVLTGTLRHHESTIRLNVRLVETESESLVWSENYDRSLDDVFSVQDDISRRVVEAVAPTLTASHNPTTGTDSGDYLTYLRARHIYVDGRDNGEVEKIFEAKSLLMDLIEQSPTYARAHAGLADVWSGLAISGAISIKEGYGNGKTYALRALELDPENAEAWYALGDIRVEYDWDLQAAKDAYDKALALAPLDADGLRGYAYFLRQVGQYDEALFVYGETRELDPLSGRAIGGIFQTLLAGGRYDEAETLLDQMEARFPSPRVESMKALIDVQRSVDRRDFERLSELLPEIRQFVPEFLHIYLTALSERGRGDVVSGDSTIAELLDLTRGPAPMRLFVAQYFASFGDYESAIQYLDDSVAAKEIGLGEALTVRSLREFRNDPRFWEWVDRSGIKPLDRP